MFDLPADEDVLRELGEFAVAKSEQAVAEDNPSMNGDVFAEVNNKVREELGAEWIGKGSCRVAYSRPEWDVVLKLPFVTSLSDGREQNRVELYVWEHLPVWARDCFFPVVGDGSNTWVVMEKATKTASDAEFDVEAATIGLGEEFPFLPYDCEFFVSGNVGWCESHEQYGVLDYGKYVPAQFVEEILGSEHAENIGNDNISGTVKQYA